VFYFPTRYDDILRRCGCPLSAELQPIRRTSGYRLTAGGACLDRPASMDTMREGCGERGSQSLLAGEMEDNPRPRNGYCAPTITRVSPLTTTVSILISTTSPHLRFHTGVETRRPTLSAEHCIKVGTTALYEPQLAYVGTAPVIPNILRVIIYRQFNTHSNSTFWPHSVFMCFVWVWEQTAIISLHSINWLVCVTETVCVYCAVWA